MRAGNHEHVISLGELPCQHDLLVAHAVGRRDLTERVELGLIIGMTVAAERAPAHEGQTDLGAVVERVLGLQVNRRVLVLHGHELVAQNAARNVDLLDRGVGDTGLLRHALVHQLLDGLDGLVVRHLRVRAVEVQQVDGVHAERQCALLAAPNQVLRATVHIPRGAAVGEVAEVAHLGGHQHLVLRPLPGLKGLAHQLFTGLLLAAGAVVGPSGVDVAAAGVQRGVQGFDADLMAAVVFDGQRHFAVADGGGGERSEVTEQCHGDSLQQ